MTTCLNLWFPISICLTIYYIAKNCMFLLYESTRGGGKIYFTANYTLFGIYYILYTTTTTTTTTTTIYYTTIYYILYSQELHVSFL